MKSFGKYNTVYFVGIGGIGMSALARFFHGSGFRVAGYDRISGPLIETLISEGIEVFFDEDVAVLPQAFTDPSSTLVVYTPAVPADHKQLKWFSENGFMVLKRSRVLGMITGDMRSVCVAGTHGKTTVSTLTAYLLYHSRCGTNAFLGGIAKDFGTNFLNNPQSDLVVLEADEFDRSFWQLTPHTALITSMDPDHLDVYGTPAQVREGFAGFASRIRENGFLLIKAGLPVPGDLAKGVRVFTYSMKEDADFRVLNIRFEKGKYSFDMETPDGVIENFTSGMPGLINVENAAAAIALSLISGASPEELKDNLPNFQGIARRFDVLINTPQLVYIDDYAHHPEEIRATLKSVRDAFPGREVTGIFQPHLYTRTRDFADEFAR
ncbi:MAG: UDP-N-acetylmuramate--L-alanine ligase, partial [Marinilabiliaceae bacterium]